MALRSIEMSVQIRSLAYAIVLANLLLAAWPSRANNYCDWSGETDFGPSSKWSNYFKENARIRLGPEGRLPNGVSWRLLTDLHSGAAIPRVTWMPNRHHLRVATQLLTTVHGGEMLVGTNCWPCNEHLGITGLTPARCRHEQMVGSNVFGAHRPSFRASGSASELDMRLVKSGYLNREKENSGATVTDCGNAKPSKWWPKALSNQRV